jgi:hypothetical protein
MGPGRALSLSMLLLPLPSLQRHKRTSDCGHKQRHFTRAAFKIGLRADLPRVLEQDAETGNNRLLLAPCCHNTRFIQRNTSATVSNK